MMSNAPEYLSSKFLKRAEVSSRSIRNSQLLNIPFLKLLAAKEPFIIEQLISGILWIVLLNCVIQFFKTCLRTKLLKES